MQIRVANKQDEPLIRTIVFQSLEDNGVQSNLEGSDSDLRNVERNYFWYDGLCIVAENEGQIIGVLAARRREGQEEILELKRLVVTPGARKRGAAKGLMKTMLFFARNMEYKKVVLTLPERDEPLKNINGDALKRLGLTEDESGVWQLNVPSSRTVSTT